MRIGLFGQFGSGNSGNDGSLEAMIQTLGRICPDAELICITSHPQAVRDAFHVDAVAINGAPPRNAVLRFLDAALAQLPRRARDFYTALALAYGLDLVIVPGTGILDDFQEDPTGWPFTVFRWSLAARLAGTRLAFVSIGAGPIRHPFSKRLMIAAARMAGHRSYRDERSRGFMRSAGIDVANDPVNCDLVFGLPIPLPERPHGAPLTVGVGVMTYTGWNKTSDAAEATYATYLAKILAFVHWLLQGGITVRLLTGDRGDRRALHDVADAVAAAAGPDGRARLIVEEAVTLEELSRQIAQTDLVVASRYHNVICALKAGRPVMSLGYADKNDDLLRRVGLDAFCHRIGTFDVEAVKADLQNMLARRTELEELVRAGVDAFAGALSEQEGRLETSLLCRRHRRRTKRSAAAARESSVEASEP
jgi:polysaccharide pyruvyl transferase WcaK-like protein